MKKRRTIFGFILLATFVYLGCGSTKTTEDLQQGYLHIVCGSTNSVRPYSVEPEQGTLIQLNRGSVINPGNWSATTPILSGAAVTGNSHLFLLESGQNELQAMAINLTDGTLTFVQTLALGFPSGQSANKLYYQNDQLVIAYRGGGNTGDYFDIVNWNGSALVKAAGSPFGLTRILPGAGLFQDGHLFFCAEPAGLGSPVVLHHFMVDSATGVATAAGTANLVTTDVTAYEFGLHFDGSQLFIATYGNGKNPAVDLIEVTTTSVTTLDSLVFATTGVSGGKVLKVGERYLVGETRAQSLIHCFEIDGANNISEATGFPVTLTNSSVLSLDVAFGDYIYFRDTMSAMAPISRFRSSLVNTDGLTDVSTIVQTFNVLPQAAVRQGKLFVTPEGGGAPSQIHILKADLTDGTLTEVGYATITNGNPHFPLFTLVP